MNAAAKQFWKKTRFYSLEMYFVFHGNPHFLSLLYALFSNFLARCVKQSFSSSQCNGKSFLTFGPSDFVNRIATSWTNDRKFLANHCSKVAKWVDMGWTWMKSQWVKLFRYYLLLHTVFFTLWLQNNADVPVCLGLKIDNNACCLYFFFFSFSIEYSSTTYFL